jgi:hypothetical protein
LALSFVACRAKIEISGSSGAPNVSTEAPVATVGAEIIPGEGDYAMYAGLFQGTDGAWDVDLFLFAADGAVISEEFSGDYVNDFLTYNKSSFEKNFLYMVQHYLSANPDKFQIGSYTVAGSLVTFYVPHDRRDASYEGTLLSGGGIELSRAPSAGEDTRLFYIGMMTGNTLAYDPSFHTDDMRARMQ